MAVWGPVVLHDGILICIGLAMHHTEVPLSRRRNLSRERFLARTEETSRWEVEAEEENGVGGRISLRAGAGRGEGSRESCLGRSQAASRQITRCLCESARAVWWWCACPSLGRDPAGWAGQ